MRLPLLAFTLLLVLAAAAPASAASRLRLGISDQKATMFEDKRFRALNVKDARIALPYDAYLTRDNHARRAAEEWLLAARLAKVQPLVSITHSYKHQYRLPSVRTYRRAIRAIRKAHPWLHTFSTWNEGNHQSQPTFRAPRRHAQFFSALRQECRGCVVLAGEFLDSDNLKNYSCRFQHWLPKRKGLKLRWGLHNYQDANPRKGLPRNGTARFLQLVRGEVWLTETGGIVRFEKDGRTARPFSISRAARALRAVFSIAQRQPRVQRVYLYHWQAGPRKTTNWDSGFISEHGSARSTLNVLRAASRRSARKSWRRGKGAGTRYSRSACAGVNVRQKDRAPKRSGAQPIPARRAAR
jgi:hypothetical protein